MNIFLKMAEVERIQVTTQNITITKTQSPQRLKLTEAKRDPPEQRFHRNAVAFCDYIKEIIDIAQEAKVDCPVKKLTMMIVQPMIEATDPHKIITTFIEKSNKSWDKIYDKDLNYFRNPEGLSIFGDIPKEHVEAFSKLLDYKLSDDKPLIDDSSKENLWKFFHAFVKQSICYIYLQRMPDPITHKPTKVFYPEISVKKLSQKWKISKLE